MPTLKIFELIKIATDLAAAIHKDSAAVEPLVEDVETAFEALKSALSKAQGAPAA